MKVIVLNGSPRKGWNTHMMLQSAADGAQDAGAEVEMIHLFDLDYKGCRGCYTCKLRGGGSLGHCVINDDLKPVLSAIDAADGLIIGSPIYFGDTTACVRAFLERFLYQYQNHDGTGSFAAKRVRCACVYTMNIPKENLAKIGNVPARTGEILSLHTDYIGSVESFETMHMKDYDKYHFGKIDVERRREIRETRFPVDLQRAYELGKKVVG